MAEIVRKRVCADIEGDFVVFLIGMRLNKPWKVWKWWPVARAMPRMLAELSARPELGLLGFRTMAGFPTITVLQYWRSFEALEAYARSRDAAHLPAWRDFNLAVGASGDVGIWHETYVVRSGDHESVYMNMPLFGLAKASRAVDARESARQRMDR